MQTSENLSIQVEGKQSINFIFHSQFKFHRSYLHNFFLMTLMYVGRRQSCKSFRFDRVFNIFNNFSSFLLLLWPLKNFNNIFFPASEIEASHSVNLLHLQISCFSNFANFPEFYFWKKRKSLNFVMMSERQTEIGRYKHMLRRNSSEKLLSFSSVYLMIKSSVILVFCI